MSDARPKIDRSYTRFVALLYLYISSPYIKDFQDYGGQLFVILTLIGMYLCV
jgi:hypothetical protein